MPSPDDLLADAPIGAAVAALAERNRHHLEQMTDAERSDALSHWHDLAVTVLTAAGAALGGERRTPTATSPGRAVIVLEDAGGDEVAVHASFFPQLEDLGGEVLVTPAQAAALELLEAMTGGDEDETTSCNKSRSRRTSKACSCLVRRPAWWRPEDALPGPSDSAPRPRDRTSCSGPR